jgi:hypothetical protein
MPGSTTKALVLETTAPAMNAVELLDELGGADDDPMTGRIQQDWGDIGIDDPKYRGVVKEGPDGIRALGFRTCRTKEKELPGRSRSRGAAERRAELLGPKGRSRQAQHTGQEGPSAPVQVRCDLAPRRLVPGPIDSSEANQSNAAATTNGISGCLDRTGRANRPANADLCRACI